mmetsp:Transcript_7123/g.15561  ORF Transcript_7123/g.15561 Transcript_7123/m.15561 type:complete len:116 (+) Transcript_7123:127-474(+)|eukprot:CAMPEP_0178481546 /NCGR_PEP_ID=MMETSP0696-20121128/6272_1 /TAXON_ID=265572 /ORGANISM="Extubocellulus spinifer, Strain CCMP396" /LENGTH=115 /DNA_ID=CAMNT_0020109031 /DNA_START=63 /DNA_END=410 /DNA_ORIENTATION=-
MSIAEFYIDHGIGFDEDVCEALRDRGILPPLLGGVPERFPNNNKRKRGKESEPTLPSHGTVTELNRTGNKRKRKNEAEPTRTCAACNEVKGSGQFSKNQRRKGSAGRCMECVASK